MHELGIVFRIADMVEEVAVQNQAKHVSKTVVEVGEVSTVIPEYLIDCWKWRAAKSEILKDCELVVEVLPAITYCEDCGTQYETLKFAKICPNCGSEHTYLIQGNEHSIKEIVVDDESGEEREDMSVETDVVTPYSSSEPGGDGMDISVAMPGEA